eukprot:1336537-Pleurochrysis_carterae.AAC.1
MTPKKLTKQRELRQSSNRRVQSIRAATSGTPRMPGDLAWQAEQRKATFDPTSQARQGSVTAPHSVICVSETAPTPFAYSEDYSCADASNCQEWGKTARQHKAARAIAKGPRRQIVSE